MAARRPGPAETQLLADLDAMRLDPSGVLVQLALALARRVDRAAFTAADAQQLRLTWAAIREEGRPARSATPPDGQDAGEDVPAAVGETALERARRRREARERDGGR